MLTTLVPLLVLRMMQLMVRMVMVAIAIMWMMGAMMWTLMRKMTVVRQAYQDGDIKNSTAVRYSWLSCVYNTICN